MSFISRGRGGKQVSRDNRAEAHPYLRPASKDDLHCVHCGYIIRDGRNRKLASCPNNDCRKFLPLTSSYGCQGWGRCLAPSCWRFTNRDYCYCESCGHANREAIEKQHRFIMADLQRANIKNKVLTEDLKKTNEEQCEKIKKLEELLAQKEEVHFRNVYKADKNDSEAKSNCVDGELNADASDTKSDSMEGEVSQQILDDILDLEKSASEKEEIVMDVDLLLKDD